MDINIIKRIIADQKEEIEFRNSAGYIEREKTALAKSFLNENIIKVITGIRRCGKSTFCHQLLKDENYAYLNFDDERLYNVKAENLDKFLEELLRQNEKPKFLLFDEIQNIKGWELFINRLYRMGYNIVLTGSNSNLLSRELATHLTGRHIQIELFPFSFAEYLKYKGFNNDLSVTLSTRKTAELKKTLDEYIEFGGFPEIKNFNNKKIYLRDLFEKIILKDIVERFSVRDINTLKELALYMLNNFSSLFTFSRINNLLSGGSSNTLKEYIGYLEETYLLFYTKKHSFKMSEEIRSPRKIYTIDIGLLNAMDTSLNRNYGRKIENLVYLHERRNNRQINYISGQSFEVDFIIKNQEQIKLIQAAAELNNEKTLNREISSLLKASELFPNAILWIITENEEDTIIKDNKVINILPLWKYLTQSHL